MRVTAESVDCHNQPMLHGLLDINISFHCYEINTFKEAFMDPKYYDKLDIQPYLGYLPNFHDLQLNQALMHLQSRSVSHWRDHFDEHLS
jgi:hypothetical protein